MNSRVWLSLVDQAEGGLVMTRRVASDQLIEMSREFPDFSILNCISTLPAVINTTEGLVLDAPTSHTVGCMQFHTRINPRFPER